MDISARVLADVSFSLTVRRAVRPGRVDELLRQLSRVTDVPLTQLKELVAGTVAPEVGADELDQQLETIFLDIESQGAAELEAWARDGGLATERIGRLVLMVLDDKAVAPEI